MNSSSQRRSSDENYDYLSQRKNSAFGIGVMTGPVQSPKLRNRFSLNLPMSSLRKKMNRRSSGMPTIEDCTENDTSPSDPASPLSKNDPLSNEVFKYKSPTGLNHFSSSSTPSPSHDSVFSLPTQSGHKNLTVETDKIARNAQSEGNGRLERQKSSLYSTLSLSSGRLLDDLGSMPGCWSPGSLRRGSMPAFSQAATRHRSSSGKAKVSSKTGYTPLPRLKVILKK